VQDSPGQRRDEKMRLCPTCRMEISVLATKCRYCGEEVGRPRDESRSLSVSDLGGETVQHYAPSSSVMEALEAFRSETEEPKPQVAPTKSGMFGRLGKKQQPETKAKNPNSGLPELDERSQALASLAMPSSTNKYQPKAIKQERSIPRTVAVFAGLVAAMVIFYFGAVQIFANRTPEPQGSTYENPAVDMLAAGEDPLLALQESLRVEGLENHEEHREVSQEARRLVLANIDAILNKNPWRPRDLDSAIAQMRKVSKIDQHPNTLRKQEEVDFENKAYSMSLDTIDPEAGRASFIFRGALEDNMKTTGGEGDLILSRFEIQDIRRDRVSVEDVKRGDRPLTWRTNGEITSP
jgi:hypothetical protein